MSKPQSQLLSWFDRERAYAMPDITPVLVTRERAREARSYLQKHSRFEYEKFRQDLEVDQLIREPLGETLECLSAEDLANVIRSHLQEPPETLDTRLIAHAVAHVQNCPTCFENIAAYQEMECRSVENALTQHIRTFPPQLWIGPVGQVEVVEGAEPRVGFWVAMHDAPGRDVIEPIRAKFSYPFETPEVPLYRVQDTPESDQQITKAYYQSARMRELEPLKGNSCGFVAVAQQVGGSEFRSTRVIRLERCASPLARPSDWMAPKLQASSSRRVVVLQGYLAASTDDPIVGSRTTGRFQIELTSIEATRRHARLEVRVGSRAGIGVRWLSGSPVRRKGDAAPLGRSGIAVRAPQGVAVKKVLEEVLEWAD